MSNAAAYLTLGLTDNISRGAKQASTALKGLGADLLKLQKDASNVDVFRSSMKSFQAARTTFNAAKQNVEALARAYAEARKRAEELGTADAAKGAKKAGQDLDRARTQVERAAKAYERFKEQVLSAKNALQGGGVNIGQLASEQARLTASINKTTAALERQRRLAPIKNAAMAAAGAVAGYRAKEIGKKAIVSAADFDIGVREQRAFAGVSQEDQDKLLIPQAKKIGQDTKFTNLDVVHAQTAVMQRLGEGLPKAQIAAGITQQVQYYAQALHSDMKGAAESITAFLTGSQKDISTQEKALTEARRTTNLLIRMAKLGGMNDDDLQAFTRFGVPTGSLAGVSDATMGAIGVNLKRAGFGGDQAGVFMRALGSRLVSPTKAGKDALSAAGIDHSKFLKTPDGGFSPEGLSTVMAQRYGKKLSPEMMSKVREKLGDEDTIESVGGFVASLSETLAPLFAGKSGKMAAKDAKSLASTLAAFHKNSIESVDTEGLLRAIFSSPMGLGALNSFMSDKHGGKLGALIKGAGAFESDRNQLSNIPDDYGKKISDEIMGGLGGSLTQLQGSVENLILSLGKANEGILKLSFDKLGALMDAFSNLPDGVKQATTGLALLGAAATTAAGIKGLLGGFGLSTSAGLLSKSAAELSAAALIMKGGAAVPAGAAAAGAGAAGAAGAGGLGMMSLLRFLALPIAGAAALTYIATQRAQGEKDNPDRVKDVRGRGTGSGLSKAFTAPEDNPQWNGVGAKAAESVKQSFESADFSAAGVQAGQAATTGFSAAGFAAAGSAAGQALLSAFKAAVANLSFSGATSAPSTPGRASGGFVSAGRLYRVGEHGSELFAPGESGRIFNKGQSGGSRAARGGTLAPSINLGGITITHHGDADSLVETIKEKIEAGLRESVRSLYADYGLEEPG